MASQNNQQSLHSQQLVTNAKHRISASSGYHQAKNVQDYSSLRNTEQDQQKYASLGKTDHSINQHQQVVRTSQKSSTHRYQQSVQVINSKPEKQSQNQASQGFNPMQMLKSQMESLRGSQSPPKQQQMAHYQDHVQNRGSREDVRYMQQAAVQNRRVTNLKTSKQQSNGSLNEISNGANGVQIRRNQAPTDINGTKQSTQISHTQRSKFQGSFLANHNSKTGKQATDSSGRVAHKNLSVSPAVVQGQPQIECFKASQLKPGQGQSAIHHNPKIVNKSPMAVSNPSSFTITTTTNNMMFNSNSPHNLNSNGSGGASANRMGSNPTSVRHNSTKQSDVLMATDQSSTKHRENIKVFSFKPGNLKVQAKQLNVQSIKPGHISLTKEQQAQLIGKKAKTRVPTVAQTSPVGALVHDGKIQFSKVTTARNRSSGSTVSGKNQVSQGPAKAGVVISQRRTSKNQNAGYSSPDGNVSNESKRQAIVMQPNIVKKPLMTNYSREDSVEDEDYNSPNQYGREQQVSVRAQKKNVQPTILSTKTSKRIKSASRHSNQNGVQATTELSSARPSESTGIVHIQNSSTSTAKRIKIKKRGHSENIQTETSNQRNSQNSNMLLLNSQVSLAHQKPSIQKTHKVVKSMATNNFSQRGHSLQGPQNIDIEVNQKLAYLKREQDAEAARQFDHKEVIVNHIRKYIKLQPEENQGQPTQVQSSEKSDLIIQNLREFLGYLESKNIINPHKLQNQAEMKNLIKDIMKLDLSKFSKPRSSSNSQTRQPKHQMQQQMHDHLQLKKRKVGPSPANHEQQESRTVPTQFTAPTNSSQQSIANFAKVQEILAQGQSKQLGQSDRLLKAQARTKQTSVETSKSPNPGHVVQDKNFKYEYASQPKYLNYGMLAPQQKVSKTSGKRSREHSSGTNASPDKCQTSESRVNLSSVNFVLPSNRTVKRNAKDGMPQTANTDVYGVKSLQASLLQSSQNSPEVNKACYKLKREVSKSGYHETNQSNHDAISAKSKSVRQSLKPSSGKQNSIRIENKDLNVKSIKVKRSSASRGDHNYDSIAVEQHLQQLKQSSQKPRLYSGRGSKTAAPSTTQQSPSGYKSGNLQSHPKVVSSQPNLVTNQHPEHQGNLNANNQQQQVPTIQLMINTNGQGKFLGINVNNYCFAPATDSNQQPQQSNNPQQNMNEANSRQIQQLIQMQNNSAEQLQRAQAGIAPSNKKQKSQVKTEPDQDHSSILNQSKAYKVGSSNNNYRDQKSAARGDTKNQQTHNSSILNDFVRQQMSSKSSLQNSQVLNHRNGQPNGHDRLKLIPGQSVISGSSEFEIADQHQSGLTNKRGGSYFDKSVPQSDQTSQANKYNSGKISIHAQRRLESRQMMIHDEDDDNTGGNGAEAKMSPTAMGASINNIFNASRLLQGSHQETPSVPKQQMSHKQNSSSTRGGSGRSSQRTSSLNKALDINKSQIQANLMDQKVQIRQQEQRRPSKESSHDRQIVSQESLIVDNKHQSRVSSKVQTNAPSTMNSPVHITSSKVVLNDPVTEDREKLVRYVKAYVKKHSKIPHTTLDFYRFVKLLGKGAFGKITLGIHKLTGKYVAIKSIDKCNIKDEYSRRKVFQEVYILKKIRHSCVIRLLEVFESEKHFLMVMEYSGGGDLLQYVKKRKRLNEQSAKAIFKQILYALGHCHCRSVLHRDIKLDNVLMDGEGGVKLCDFGVSRLVKKGNTINEQCGTPAYLAPEIILDKGYQGWSADIWSLGVLLYAMVQGTVPFKAHNIADLHKLILKGEFEFPVDSVSQDVKDLVKQMLVLDPTKRISIPSMLNHPWVADMQRELGEETPLDSEHDLRVGSTFFREEVLGGLISGCQSDGNENGNINFVNVENLYYRGGSPPKEPQTDPEEKVTYSDYCALTEDFMTYRIDEEAMEIVTSFGYPRSLVLESINRGDVNHATAAYYLLVY